MTGGADRFQGDIDVDDPVVVSYDSNRWDADRQNRRGTVRAIDRTPQGGVTGVVIDPDDGGHAISVNYMGTVQINDLGAGRGIDGRTIGHFGTVRPVANPEADR